MTPEVEIKLARSALIFELGYTGPLASLKEAVSPRPRFMTVPESTDSGSDSRLPPNIDAGANAFIEAFVSTEFLRRRLEDEARVRIEASSVNTLFAVAV